MKNNYKYNEPMVRFYDAVYDNLPAVKDKSYYVDKLVNAGGPALEIGCGTGRLFCEALKQGADVYGIDQNELMQNKLKEKIDESQHYRVHLMDATELSLDMKFKLIIAPFRMFQHVYTVEDQLKVLGNVREHLVDGGRFIFDVFRPNPKYLDTETEESLQYEGEYAPGKFIRRYHSFKPDVLNQTQYIKFRFEWDEDDEIKHDEFITPMRYFFRYELEHLAARAGLKLINIYGDTEENPISNENWNFIVECEK
jgi:SAM-dependent methyltransferase